MKDNVVTHSEIGEKYFTQVYKIDQVEFNINSTGGVNDTHDVCDK